MMLRSSDPEIQTPLLKSTTQFEGQELDDKFAFSPSLTPREQPFEAILKERMNNTLKAIIVPKLNADDVRRLEQGVRDGFNSQLDSLEQLELQDMEEAKTHLTAKMTSFRRWGYLYNGTGVTFGALCLALFIYDRITDPREEQKKAYSREVIPGTDTTCGSEFPLNCRLDCQVDHTRGEDPPPCPPIPDKPELCICDNSNDPNYLAKIPQVCQFLLKNPCSKDLGLLLYWLGAGIASGVAIWRGFKNTASFHLSILKVDEGHKNKVQYDQILAVLAKLGIQDLEKTNATQALEKLDENIAIKKQMLANNHGLGMV